MRWHCIWPSDGGGGVSSNDSADSTAAGLKSVDLSSVVVPTEAAETNIQGMLDGITLNGKLRDVFNNLNTLISTKAENLSQIAAAFAEADAAMARAAEAAAQAAASSHPQHPLGGRTGLPE